MSALLIHTLDTAWTSSNAAALTAVADASTLQGPFAATNQLIARAGALNATATFTSAAPLDLSRFDEIRFWILSATVAEGTRRAPFFLEFSWSDAGDTPGEEHRWFISVNRSNQWEQRRIGIATDRRTAITEFRFRVIANFPFVCWLSELLAVSEQMLEDVENALTGMLDSQVIFPGLTQILAKQAAAAGANQVALPLTTGLAVANRIRVNDGAGHIEFHNIGNIAQDALSGTSTVTLAAGETLTNALTAGVSFVSLTVPTVAEAPPAPDASTTPAILLTMLDAREDLPRSSTFTQRDSFRPRGSLTFASTRPAPRAYFIDYQINSVAPQRAQQIVIQEFVLTRLSIDNGLRINGALAPVEIRPPTDLLNRQVDILAPLLVRIGTRLEVAPRTEQPWIQRTDVEAGQMRNGIISSSSIDLEGIVINL